MGALLETLHSPRGLPALCRDCVSEKTRRRVWSPGRWSSSDVRRADLAAAHAGDMVCTPFEILSIGGDDLFLMVPAHQALPIAIQIAQAVEGQLKQDKQFKVDTDYDPEQVHRCPVDTTSGIGKAPQSTVGLVCRGVAGRCKNPHLFPAKSRRTASEKSAKRRAKELKKHHHYFGGTIDFMALKSVTMITSRLNELRQLLARGTGLSHSTSLYFDRDAAVAERMNTENHCIPPFTTLRLTAQSVGGAMGVDRKLPRIYTERLGEPERTQLCTGKLRRREDGAAPWRPIGPERAAETVLVDLRAIVRIVEE